MFKIFKLFIRKFEKLIFNPLSMFLIVDVLNEGKTIVNKAKSTKTLHSEGKGPKTFIAEEKLRGNSSTKSQSCVNSNWQKLRG